MEMNVKISALVLAKMASGMDVIDALKAVCGADKVDVMIGDLYETLRARG